jgi:hypothetical protein
MPAHDGGENAEYSQGDEDEGEVSKKDGVLFLAHVSPNVDLCGGFPSWPAVIASSVAIQLYSQINPDPPAAG